MTHEIETHQGQAAAIFARQDAWHRLGTTVAGRAFTAEEAMTLGHLGGWNVRKSPVETIDMDTDGVSRIEVPGAYATVRTSPFTGCPEPLGVVGTDYTVIQNEAHAQFLNTLTDQSGASFETAGSLRGGRQVFVTMRLPEHLSIGGSDRVDLNLAAINSHDGSSAFQLLVTPVRVVCANTLHAALGNHHAGVKIRHTRNASQAVQVAREALGMTYRYVEAFETQAEAMIATSITDREFEQMMGQVFGVPDPQAGKRSQTLAATRAHTLTQLWADAPTQDGIRGTAWAAHQVVTEYLDHFAPVRAQGREQSAARAQRTLTSPDADRLKTRAWQVATAGA